MSPVIPVSSISRLRRTKNDVVSVDFSLSDFMLQIPNRKLTMVPTLNFALIVTLLDRKMSEHQFFSFKCFETNTVGILSHLNEAFLAGMLNISSGEDYHDQAALLLVVFQCLEKKRKIMLLLFMRIYAKL